MSFHTLLDELGGHFLQSDVLLLHLEAEVAELAFEVVGAGVRFFDFFALGVEFGLGGLDEVDFLFVSGLEAVEKVGGGEEEGVEGGGVEGIGGAMGKERGGDVECGEFVLDLGFDWWGGLCGFTAEPRDGSGCLGRGRRRWGVAASRLRAHRSFCKGRPMLHNEVCLVLFFRR